MSILNKYTLKTLKRNKSRTAVTIVGIILSLAMMTGVTVLISSSQNFLVKIATASGGNWHGRIYNGDNALARQIRADEDVEKTFLLENIGYSQAENSLNAYKPYIYVCGADKDFFENMPVQLISGRLPENGDEIILPAHLAYNGGINYALDDLLSLNIGNRELNGETLWQYNSYDPDEGEVLNIVSHRDFTVVGFYSRPSFEDYSAPGYTAITYSDCAGENNDIYYLCKDVNNTIPLLNEYVSQNTTYSGTWNYYVLRFYGRSKEDGYNAVLYGLAVILLTIIVLASISLIYNAFAISVGERTKQFGLLSTVGATKRQLMNSVLFEAFILCCIGIPLGILSGILGIGVTLQRTDSLFKKGINYLVGDVPYISNMAFTLHISYGDVAVAVVLGILTVMVSAYIPAHKALKVSAIDAIRQSDDIKIKNKHLKVNPIVTKLFGFEGMIAAKSFRRSRKRYRATIISLFMSIVLFVSAYSFCDYFGRGVLGVIDDVEYDLIYYYYSDNFPGKDKDFMSQQYRELKNSGYVTNSAYFSDVYVEIVADRDDIDSDYFSENLDSDSKVISASMLFVDDESYGKWLDENNLDRNVYMNSDNPVGIVNNKFRLYDSSRQKYYTYNAFKNDSLSFEIVDYDKMYEAMLGYSQSGVEYVDDTVYMRFIKEDSDAYQNETAIDYTPDTQFGDDVVYVPKKDFLGDNRIETVGYCTNMPFGLSGYKNVITVIFPYSAIDNVLPQSMAQTAYESSQMMFSCSDVDLAEQYMNIYLTNYGMSGFLYNARDDVEVSRAILIIVRVFIYGFITLISLIALANVINTISTNIMLRRREFAILRSVGLADKGIDRMMYYECLLYGFKSVLYGIPVAIAMTYWIYLVTIRGWDTSFTLPWTGMFIAIAGVFAVVFIAMMYSAKKIKNENTMDALKNENL